MSDIHDVRTAMKQTVLVAVTGAGLLATQSSAQAPECNRDCLIRLNDQYLSALVAQDPSGLPWSDRVGHTENDVGLMIGDGLWGTATRIGEGYAVADSETGNVVWLGIVEEHGQAAYLGLRLAIAEGEIAEVEAVVGREGPPAAFAPTAGYAVDAAFSETVPPIRRAPRARMIALVEGYYNSMQLNDGKVLTEISDDCSRQTNGYSTTHGGDIDVEGCRQQLEIGWYRPVDRVRARRFPVVDEERGVVVALAFLDHASRYTSYETLDGQERQVPVEYPNTHGLLELFKIDDGEITRIEGVTSFQPYLMPTQWDR